MYDPSALSDFPTQGQHHAMLSADHFLSNTPHHLDHYQQGTTQQWNQQNISEALSSPSSVQVFVLADSSNKKAQSKLN